METLGERQREDDLHWNKDKKQGQWRTIPSEKKKGKNEASGDRIKRKRVKRRKNRETYTDKSLLLCFCGSSVNTTAFSVRARLNLP